MNLRRIMLVTVCLVTLIAAQASALDFQQKQFYGQAVAALPMGDFGDFANFGFGAGVGLLVPHSEQLSFRGEATYLYYLDDAEGDADVSLWQIPVQVLAQYSLTNSKVYLLGGLGLAWTHVDLGLDDEFDALGIEVDDSATETDVALALGAGYALSPKMVLEGRFNLISDANSVSAHLGYRF